MGRLRLSGLVLGVGIALAAPALSGPALAAAGTRIGPSRISMARPAAPGQVYALDSLSVANTGSDPATYNIRVERLKSSDRRLAPSQWLTLGPTTVALAAGQSTLVRMTLRIPADASRGDYLTNVVATTAPTAQSQGTGAVLGAGAAADVEFTVSGAGADTAPWWPLALVALLAIGAGLFYSSGYTIRVSPRKSKRPVSSPPQGGEGSA